MSGLTDALQTLRDTLLRLMPHATRPGLYPVGEPGPDAPVLVTCNFALTVRRLRRALAGHDVWLLVVNSDGINVWCAASGGHMTEHQVIAALRAFGVAERVHHRTLVLPQLSATGIERRRIAEATGWRTRWGPARLEDLPAFLESRGQVTKRQRWMRFPLWERAEMSVMWWVPMALIVAAVLGPSLGWHAAVVGVVVVVLQVSVLFAALPWLPVMGARGWGVFALFAAAGAAAGVAGLAAAGEAAPPALLGETGAALGAMLLLSVDLTGTTPWYPGTVNSLFNRFEIELVTELCTGAAECVQVCPRNVLRMLGPAHKVEIARPDDCIRCGACIVQCPEDALRFRFTDGRIVVPAAVRSTKLNMLGRRAVPVIGQEAPRQD